ncbi:unnamed protein product [Ectocarpus sp. 12 AP-2014]
MPHELFQHSHFRFGRLVTTPSSQAQGSHADECSRAQAQCDQPTNSNTTNFLLMFLPLSLVFMSLRLCVTSELTQPANSITNNSPLTFLPVSVVSTSLRVFNKRAHCV